MEEMKNYKQNFRSLSNAFYWANQSWFSDNLTKKIFENNLHLNPPRAARISAVINVATYDGSISCCDAKYAYRVVQPNQYDAPFRTSNFITPQLPRYPSGHAALARIKAEVCIYFVPDEKELCRKKAKEAAEPRFQ